MNADVTLIGAGKLGAAFAARWQAAGRTVVVWNRTAARAEELAAAAGDGVCAMADLAEAVAAAPVVVSVVTDGAALRSIFEDQGGLAAMRSGASLVELSTTDAATSAELAAACAARGLGYVSGAVSGTAAVVRVGAAGLLLSGAEAALASAAPLLDDLSANQVVVGVADEAKIAKLGVNMLLAATMQGVAEAVVMAEAAGLPRETFLDALDATVLSSRFLSFKGGALRAREYAATFRTADLLKDVDLALDQAGSGGVHLAATGTIRAELAEAIAAGYADDDFLSMLKVIQRASGQPVDGS